MTWLSTAAVADKHDGTHPQRLIRHGGMRAVIYREFLLLTRNRTNLLLSILPTVTFIRWRQAAKAESTIPGASEIARIRKFLWAELAVFALIPICAAAMARGYGMMG